MSKVDWAKVDWSKRTCELAKDYGVTIDTISRYRRQCAPHTLRSRFNGWRNIDWTKNNQELAQELGKSYDTVAKKRWRLAQAGKAKERAVRIDKGISKVTNIPSPEQQRYATERAKLSPKSGKFETNVHAKKWRITSPENQVFTVTNLYQFVRKHAYLFLPGDVIFKRTGGKRGTGGEYCNATSGLANASATKRKMWKGWRCEKIEENK